MMVLVHIHAVILGADTNMKYYGLCSGSKGNCWMIQTKKTIVMLDCGMSKKYLLEKMQECNVNSKAIDALLITHTHSDHVKQLKAFSHLPVYSVCPLDVGVRVQPYQSFQLNDLKITPLAASHDAEGCCGYLFENESQKLLYLTDTGYVSKVNLDWMQNLDYYILESNHDVEMLMNTSRPFALKSRIYSDTGHLCNEDCGKILALCAGDKTREITLAHLSEEANTPKKAYDVVKSYLVHYKGLLQVAHQREVVQGGTE